MAKGAKIKRFGSPLRRHLGRQPKALGILLCYNDADFLPDAIEHLLANHHDVVAWDHGSTDDTAKVLDRYDDRLLERKFLPRSFDFYKLYPTMSQHIIDKYAKTYDWVSWPDQDEILEGPHRDKSYYEYISEVFCSKYNWIQFNNFNYWFTEKDDPKIKSPVERIKYYSLFSKCAPRIRSWRANVTNIREFNHNPLPGEPYPTFFNLRHYSMRNEAQMLRRLDKDRADLKRGNKNVHYDNMNKHRQRLMLKSHQLHFDDGSELDHTEKIDWQKIYF